MAKKKLKPCPFCGNKEIVAILTDKNVGVAACLNCGGQIRHYGDVDMAIKLWNRRAVIINDK